MLGIGFLPSSSTSRDFGPCQYLFRRHLGVKPVYRSEHRPPQRAQDLCESLINFVSTNYSFFFKEKKIVA